MGEKAMGGRWNRVRTVLFALPRADSYLSFQGGECMRKGLFVFLSLALVVALAVPAAAEMKLTGFYRVRATTANYPFAGNASFNTSTSLTKANTSGSVSFTE